MPSVSVMKLFGESPIRPLQKHMKVVCECVHELEDFFIAVLREDWKSASEIQGRIVRFENEADELKRELRIHLPKGLFMPIQRTDVLELLARQDQLANKARDIAGIVIGRQMVLPEVMRESFFTFLKRVIDAVNQAYKTINELDKLAEVGFKGKEVTIVKEMIDTLFEIECDTDKMEIEVRHALFTMESQLPPVNVIFLYKVIEWTGGLANRAEHVGDGVQILIAR